MGKTFLVEQTFNGYFAFRATGVEGATTRQQLRSFNQRLQEHGDTIRKIPHDWFEAFSRLEAILSRDDTTRSPANKRVVFFDEFPWFATKRSDFLMAFGEFWNRCGTSQGDYLFIICGSATSWIIGNILENTGSLYNRVTCQLHLEPFDLRETETLFRDRDFGWSRTQIAECHMVFGGLPYYFDLLDPNQSLGQNIDRLCLAPHALLGGESRLLLESTLKKSPVYAQILARLARNRYGLPKQQCLDELDIAKGTFGRAVDDLVRCGYVSQYKNPRGRQKQLYLMLSDAFLLFHYRFLTLQQQGPTTWEEAKSDQGSYYDWRGHAFELLCLRHVRQIKEARGIAGVRTTEYPWKSQKVKGGAQIDLVIERADGICDLCEMKFTDGPFVVSAEDETKCLNKRTVFAEETGTSDALKLVLVSAQGVAGVAHTEHFAQTITLDELFE